MADRIAPDNWTAEVWSHAAVMDMQARLDPVRMTAYADDWQRAVDGLRDILVDLDRRMAGQLDGSWWGHGADASIATLHRYVAASLAGLAACRSVAVHLAELACAASDLRACIAAHLDKALAQVRLLYSGPAIQAGNAVEDIPPPPEPFPIEGIPQRTAAPAETPPQSSTAPTTSVQPAGLDPRPDLPPPTLSSDPRWRPITHSAAVPSSMSEHLGPPASASPTPPGPVPSAPHPSAVSPATMPRAASSPNMPFLGGMYPGLMGRDNAGEHRAPRYLIAAANSNELIGELPLVAPPVIGE